ncbi:MAG: nuclear transport factor 2 family protein [Pseudomonadota bacterium]|nr:nuclear transport factor 2 family protein [Pseudomonadota bacterium]
MSKSLDIVKDVYHRFSKGDLTGFLDLCADDIEWVVNGPASLEKCRCFRGRSGVQEFLRILGDSWEFSAFTPREFLVSGATVVVLGDEEGRDRNSGEPFRNRWVHVFDVEAGGIVRFREFLCHWTGDQSPPEMSWIPR